MSGTGSYLQRLVATFAAFRFGLLQNFPFRNAGAKGNTKIAGFIYDILIRPDNFLSVRNDEVIIKLLQYAILRQSTVNFVVVQSVSLSQGHNLKIL